MFNTTMIKRAIVCAAAMLATGFAAAEPLQRSLGPARFVSAPVLADKMQRTGNAKAVFADVTESQRLLASVPGAFDEFGRSVATDGNTLAVGAWGNDEGTADAENDPFTGDGAVSVFLRTGQNWAQQQRIIPSGLDKYDEFGWSVAISGDTLVVGSPGDDTLVGGVDSGSVYVYTRTAGVWTEQAKLLGSNVAGNSRFGYSVAVEGDTLIASAPRDTVGTVSRAGSAYVFTRTAGVWTQQARLTVTGAVADDTLGTSVDISGNYAVIGAEVADTPTGIDAGAAYVFLRSGVNWTFQLRLLSNAPAVEANFGRSVAIDGGTIAVSDHSRDNATGRVIVYTGANAVWPVQQTLAATGGAPSDFFGHAVALRGDVLFIGAYQADLGANADRGAAYSFQRTGSTWAQVDKFFASDASITGGTERFGFGVTLSPSAAAAGAPLDEHGALTDAGSVYVFNRGIATTTTFVPNPTTMTYGQQVTLTAQVTGGTPTGTVEFRNGANVLATAAVNGSGIASSTLTLNVGAYSIAAFYMGDTEHVASNSAATAVTVNIAATTTALSLSVGSNPSTYGQSATFLAAVAVTPPGVGPATGNVEFRDNGVLVATRPLIAGEATFTTTTLTHNSAVAHPISATYLGTTNFGSSNAGPLNFLVNKAAPTLTLVSNPNPSAVAQSVTMTATLVGGSNPTGAITFFDGISPIGSNPVSAGVATRNTSALALGTHNLQATYVGDDNHLDAQTAAPTVHNVLVSADVSVTKSNGTNFLQSGAPTTYIITINNPAGGADLDPLLVDDVLDGNFFDVNAATWSCAPAGICSPESGTGSIVGLPLDLPQDTTVVITLTVPVLANAESGVSNTVSLTMPGNVLDPDPSDNSATDADGSGMFVDGFE